MMKPSGTPPARGRLTRLLEAAAVDRPGALDELIALVYGELLQISEMFLAGERRSHSLQPSDLVNEAYLRLSGDLKAGTFKSRAHFFHAAAQAMERVLIEHARKRGRLKRGGDWRRASLNAVTLAVSEDPDGFLDLHEAIRRLDGWDPVLGGLVRLRFFAGLNIEETADGPGHVPEHSEAELEVRPRLAVQGPEGRRTGFDVMDRGRSQEVQRLFHEALEHPERERHTFLRGASGSDPDLVSLVDGLIQASCEAEGFLADEAPGNETAEVPAGAPRVGDMIGDYEILEEIGGNMGLVFKARHLLLEKVVALKVLPADWTADAERRARFERELKVMGQLQHPNLVAASDARIEGRWHLVAMELIDGLDLERLVEERGPLPVAAACEVARQAALGLEHAHERGLIHRDIKPSNLMLTTTGAVKVIDMGLARIKGEPDPSLTRTGLVMGTVSYSAPEQFRDASRVDSRADIYSLGCTLFHLLAGEPPYGEKTSVAEVIQGHLNEPFPALLEVEPALPAGLDDVLARMAAKDPGGRFATAAEAAEALRPFAEGDGLGSFLAGASRRDPGRPPGSPAG